MAAFPVELGDVATALDELDARESVVMSRVRRVVHDSAAPNEEVYPRPSHVLPDGRIAMVDVAAKPVTDRFARAQALVRMPAAASEALRTATLAKGDAFAAAQIAGILAAKQTAALIPLAHPLPLASVEVTFAWAEPTLLRIEATARTAAQTGVEMEAMVAASVAALTIYDMTKSLEKGIVIESVGLLEKRGGKSGVWLASAGADAPRK